MSNPFIDEQDTFDITVYYQENGKKTSIVDVKEGEEAPEGAESLTIKFTSPDFDTTQRIVERCTMLNDSGIPVINYLALQNALLYNLSESWDAKDDKGNEMPIETSIGKLKPAIAQKFITELQNKIGDEIVI